MHFKWNSAFSGVLASSVAILTMATSLHAIPRGPCDVPPPPVCCEEPKPGPFAFAYPYDVNLNCPSDFYFHADFIAFQAKQDGMTWAIQKANGLSTSPHGISDGKFEGFSSKDSDWGYNYGLRVGMGFYMNHDAWNLDFDWTWLNIREYKRANATTGGGVLIPLYLLGQDTDGNFIGQHSSASWSGSLNAVDVRLVKPFHVSRYFVVKPHFGLRGAWIDQHFGIDYSGFVGPSPTTFAGVNRICAHNENDFWGVGTRAGVDTDWMLGKGCWLFGNLSSSVLFGKFDVQQRLTTPPTSISGHDANIGFVITDDHYMNVPEFEMALGIGWGRFFNKMKYHIGLKAGYEFQIWWDQLNIRKFYGIGTASENGGNAYPNDVISRGNLSFNGFTFAAQLDL